MGQMFYGNNLANDIKKDIKDRVSKLKKRNIVPHLAIVATTDIYDSFITYKERQCREAGILCTIHRPLSNNLKDWLNPEKRLIEYIADLNDQCDVHAIAIQFPLPKVFENITEICESIDPIKDINCFNSCNVGQLACGIPNFDSPYCQALKKILKQIKPKGHEDDLIFGIIVQDRFISRNLIAKLSNDRLQVFFLSSADIEDYNQKTLKTISSISDILIVGTEGKESGDYIIKPDMVKENSIVIDLSCHKGKFNKLTGDCDPLIVNRVHTLTSVPGGIGPVVTACMLENICIAIERKISNG